MEMVVKYKVPIVITSLGARTDVNDAVHSYGGVTLHDIINNNFAQKAIEKGADGIIAVAAGAGGHAGVKSPFALIQEIRQWFDGPVALSGSIATGGAVLAAQAMGADFAYIGTAFIATEEARASDEYKQAIVDGSSDDIVYSNLFTGVHGNYLAPSIVKAGMDPANLPEGDVEDHELRRRRGQQGQGLEGHLGLGPGHWRRDRSGQRRGLHRKAQARIPGSKATARALTATANGAAPAAGAPPSSLGRMPLLDAAKGVACAVIVGHHLSRYGPMPAGAYGARAWLFLDWLANEGRLAVQVFLVIAGFLAAASLAPDGMLRVERPVTRILQRYGRLVMPYLAALTRVRAGRGGGAAVAR